MLSTGIHYVFIFHSTCSICDKQGGYSRTVNSSSGNQQYNIGEKPTVILYTYVC